jgi:hypothetical protein
MAVRRDHRGRRADRRCHVGSRHHDHREPKRSRGKITVSDDDPVTVPCAIEEAQNVAVEEWIDSVKH